MLKQPLRSVSLADAGILTTVLWDFRPELAQKCMERGPKSRYSLRRQSGFQTKAGNRG